MRLTWYVTDKREYLARQAEVGEAYRRVMGRHFPAMTMVVVAGLVEDEALGRDRGHRGPGGPRWRRSSMTTARPA